MPAVVSAFAGATLNVSRLANRSRGAMARGRRGPATRCHQRTNQIEWAGRGSPLVNDVPITMRAVRGRLAKMTTCH